MKRVALVTVAALTLASCGIEEGVKSDRGRGDAPRTSKRQIDGRPADAITEFPDGWANIATKCVWDGWRAFETTKANGASDLELVEDRACRHDATGPSGK